MKCLKRKNLLPLNILFALIVFVALFLVVLVPFVIVVLHPIFLILRINFVKKKV